MLKAVLTHFLLFAVALFPPGAAAAASAPLETVLIGGHEYVRAADWGKARRLEGSWTRREEIFDLARTDLKVRLVVDSREARVNGVQVWLLFPAALKHGSVYLSRLDAHATLDPIIWPAKNSAHQRIRSICLDPGHGGRDPGNQAGMKQEKAYTLLLAHDVRDELKHAGLAVTLTRYGDSYVDLPDRPAVARRRKADLFVSLHFNSAETSRGTVQGAEVYCLTPVGAASTNSRGEGSGAGPSPGNRFNDQNLYLAYLVEKSLTRGLGAEDRGVRRARFAVLRDAPAPAILVEAGFMSHPAEGKKIFSAAYRQRIAKAIVQGILAYKRAVEQD